MSIPYPSPSPTLTSSALSRLRLTARQKAHIAAQAVAAAAETRPVKSVQAKAAPARRVIVSSPPPSLPPPLHHEHVARRRDFKGAILDGLQQNINELFAEATRTGDTKARFRAVALRRARTSIESGASVVYSAQDVEALSGVGAGTVRRVQAIINNNDETSKPTAAAAADVADSNVKTVKFKNATPTRLRKLKKAHVESSSSPSSLHIVRSSPSAAHGASTLMLANSYTDVANKMPNPPLGWWKSRKLDGIRAFSDEHGNLFTRGNNRIDVPPRLGVQIPTGVLLDGELYAGRGNFGIATAVKSNANDPLWQKVRYHVFDVRHLPAGTRVEKRWRVLKELVDEQAELGNDFLHFVGQTPVTAASSVEASLNKEVALGGEGIMLREPNSLYVKGRSNALLKVKPVYDAEAVVLGPVAGKASVHVRSMLNGAEFKLGTKGVEMPAGTVVTYKYNELIKKSGKPRFPVFLRLRPDQD